MKSCCALGDALTEPRVVHESDNFFVVPTVGPMGIVGYFLVITKDHHEGMGSLHPSHYSELEQVVDLTKSRIREKLNVESLVFEHGPQVCGVRGGGCLDHAHFHIVPDRTLAKPLAATILDYMVTTGNVTTLQKINGYDALRKCHDEGDRSYMYVSTGETLVPSDFLIDVNFPVPSQFMRRIVARQGNSSLWNWKTHPDTETMQKTLDLFGRF